MYERSAIVLERYFNNKIGNEQKTKLKSNYKNYKQLVEEIQKYQDIAKEEEKIIEEFDKVAKDIMEIQQEQKKLNKDNIKLEEKRNEMFENFDEDPVLLEKKLTKLEENLEKNNKRLQELRIYFIENLTKFGEKQEERNKYSKIRRVAENNYIKLVKKVTENIGDIEISKVKSFIKTEENNIQEIIDIMINNGEDEKIGFNKNVIENAVVERYKIVKKEAECYVIAYERVKKLLLEINNEEIKLDRYKKTLKDISVKMAFLKAITNYIVSFLDNERITTINGLKIHDKLMEEACENFKLDIEQFNNLYDLILREIAGKSTKKAYKELYNKEYLKKVQEKEKKFEQETNSIKIHTGTIINSNYWRIQEIKNIYEVFQNEVTNKFEKDLSEFQLEESDDIEETNEVDVLGVKSFDFGKTNKYNNNKKVNKEDYDDYLEDEESEYEEDDYLEDEESEYEEDDYLEDEESEYEEDDYLEYEESEYKEINEIKINKNKSKEKKDNTKKEKDIKKRKDSKSIFGKIFREKE